MTFPGTARSTFVLLVHLEHVGPTVVFLSMLRAKKVTFLGTAPVYVCPTLVYLEHVGRTVVFLTFLRTESGLSALSSSWTYVVGQKGDISRHRVWSTFVLR